MMQFKNKMRRIVAGILCLCMLAGALPAYMPKADAAIVGAATELSANFLGITSDKYILSNKAISVSAKPTSTFAQFGCPALGDWVAFKLGDAPLSPGDYDVSMNYLSAGSGSVVDFFIVPASTADIGAYIAGKDAAARVDFQSGSNVKFTANLPIEDTYLLVGQAAAKGAATDSSWGGVCYFFMQNMSMQKIFPATETFMFKLGDGKWHTFDGTLKDYNASLNSNWKYYAHAASAWTDANGDPLPLNKMTGTPNGLSTDKAVYHPNYGFEIYSETTDRWMAMALDVKTPGVYLLNMKGYCYSLGAKVDFYMFPEQKVAVADNATALEKQAAVEKLIVSANYAGQMNQKMSTGGDYSQTLSEKIVIPEAGEYVLVMKCAEKYWIHLESMTTMRVGDVPPTQLIMTAGKEKLQPGEKTTLKTELYVNGIETAIDADKLTVTVSEDGVINYDATTGEIRAVDEGEVTVNASLVYGDETLETSLKIKVEFPYFEYAFPLKNWNQITTYNSYAIAGNWMYWGYSESTWPDACFTMDNYGTIRLTTQGTNFRTDTPDKWVAMQVKVDEPGTYNVSGTYYGGPTGGINELYMIPKKGIVTEADVTARLTPDRLLGSVDYYAAAWTEDMPMTLGTITLDEAGDYLMVTKGTGTKRSASANYWAFTKSLRFKTSKTNLTFALNEDELEYKGTTESSYSLELYDGTPISEDEIRVSYSSSNEKVATVDRYGKVKATGEGTAYITISITYDGENTSKIVPVIVKDSSDPESAVIDAPEVLYVRGSDDVKVTVNMKSGNVIDKLGEGDSVEYHVSDPDGAVEFNNGKITGVKAGVITVGATVKFRGVTLEAEPVEIEVKTSEKGKSTIWTTEKRETLLYNAQNDASVKSKATSYRNTADRYLEDLERLYGMIVAEGLPRYYHIGRAKDADKTTCRYCGVDIAGEYGSYGWITDALNMPWKIQCPNCRRRFPSNDFGSYYEMGLDEHGAFNRELAEARHIAKFGGLHGTGYLVNIEHPEKDEHFDEELGKVVNEGVHNWGVDDGWGYRQMISAEDEDGNPVEYEQRSYYVAYFIHEGLWRGIINSSLNVFKNAYLYTGEIKYGRAGAILLDRIADIYPDMWYYQWTDLRNDGGYKGKELDPVWSCGPAKNYSQMYDLYYPVYEDEQLIDYLSKKAELYNLENPKNSAAALRKNAEEGILHAVFEAAVEGSLAGNFGTTQAAVIAAAIALNTMPETREWLDWVMAPGAQISGGAASANRTGGNVLPQLLEVVCRDGMGNESAPGYNAMWISYLQDGADMLSEYDGYTDVNLYDNPKFMKMFSAQLPLVMGGYYTAQVGDMGSFAGKEYGVGVDPLIAAYQATGDPVYAQAIYQFNGRSTNGLRYADYVKNPSSLADDVRKVIDTYGELDMGSTAQSGYGMYALRDGDFYPEHSTKRDFWMYSGTTAGHGHWDALNLGLSAYGINMAPEIGYPKYTGTDANRIQWVSSTIAHNTVVVDEKNCEPLNDRGTPMHFDDAGRVKVMDVSKSVVYPQTDEYRRTVVMVEVDDSVSYGVDFFRVVGGKDHLYSFHSQSNKIAETEGLDLVERNGITYAGYKAGKDVKYGADPHPDSGKVWYSNNLTYPAGYTWLDNVESDEAPDQKFAVDFEISDLRGVLKDSSGLHLRMTMLNDFALDEVSVVDGYPVDNSSNPKTNIKYVLARRKGEENLDTLFTTVLEPYKGDRYLSGMEAVEVTHADGSVLSDGETAKAVKVMHDGGRVDYVVYAEDNSVEYKVDGLFTFKGFVGVATYQSMDENFGVNAEDLAYAYLNDGESIADVDGKAAYTGQVEGFTEELTMQNTINVVFNENLSAEAIDELAGRLVYIENDGVENGAYTIKSAKDIGDGVVELNIGDVTPIRAYKDSSDITKGYVYNIARGQSFRIPLSFFEDTAPILQDSSGKYSAASGSKLSFSVSASSEYGRDLTYEAVNMPRGASFDAQSATFSWTPDSTQVGQHSASIKISDGVLSSTYNAFITVYRGVGSGNQNGNGEASGAPATGGGAGGGAAGGGASGGGGGGGAPSGGGSSDTSDDDKPEDKPEDVVGGDTTEETTKFIDLGNHTWAEDAIYALVEKGVVNGTSANTYAPANNIKRADFAIMLVRAFGVTEVETEHFADVDASKYYAKELALAKANGIVGGIGDNKFNPEGEITRQDMMVMLSRALKAVGKELDAADESVLAKFADAASLSDYAREAVAQLIGAGAIAGSNGRINPLGRATRAEVAVMLNRIFA